MNQGIDDNDEGGCATIYCEHHLPGRTATTTSVQVFLTANPQANMLSFDLGQFDYTVGMGEMMKELFQERFDLILGDSKSAGGYPRISAGIRRRSQMLSFCLVAFFFIDCGRRSAWLGKN